MAPSHALETGATFSVSAQVMPVARVELAASLPAVTVTEADVAHGFVDSQEPVAMRVQSNSPTGYALDFLPRGEFFTALAVRGIGTSVSLGADGGTVVQHWHGNRTDTLSLSFRFTLAAGVQPGRYPMPLELRVRPLPSDQ